MKKITYSLVAILLFLSPVAYLFTRPQLHKPIEGLPEEANGAIAYNFNLRKNPITGAIDHDAMMKAQLEVAQHRAYMASKKGNGSVMAGSLTWKELGPSNVGGRTRGFLIDRNNPNKLFAGGVAGGLWISTDKGTTWSKWGGSDQLENICIASLTQAPNGDIYFGTGEGMYAQYGFGAGGMVGGGMWRSTDGGNTFNRIASTIPQPNTTSGNWVCINDIAFDPFNSNKIYAATNYGLRLSLNGGLSWMHPIRFINGNPNTTSTSDIEVLPDGTVFAAIGSKCYKSPSGDSATFVNISTGGTLLPSASTGRLELAVSPTDPNFIYATATSGGLLYGVYQSIDKGLSWKLIGPGGSTQFSPFGSNGQADYDNALAVDPFDKGHIILGGVTLWTWKQNTPTSYGVGQWSKIATGGGGQYYVHSDVHDITFDKNTLGLCYISGDGGISRSYNMNLPQPTFSSVNDSYNITQCYAMAFEPDNTSPLGSGVILGTQDNGTQYVSGIPNGSNLMWAKRIGGGDGAESEISQINPDAFFTTVYYGSVSRSSNKGQSSSSPFSQKIKDLSNFGGAGFASFVTPISLYENANATNSPDSVIFTADQNYAANSVVAVKSATNDQYFGYTLPTALTQGQQIKVQDIIQTKLVVGFSGSNGTWMTRQPLDFSTTPTWYRIAGSNISGRGISGAVESFGWSADGDVLFIGTANGFLYRLKNLAGVVDSLTGDIGDNTTANNQCIIQQATVKSFGSGRYVTGISVDPTNANNVAVSVSNYGQIDYVYYSNNALATTPQFSSKQGTGSAKLPAMPAYGILIEKSNPKRVLVATEWGVYKTEDITQPPTTIVWTQENGNGLPQVPVFSIRQQRLEPWHTIVKANNTFTQVTNSGRIYIGTHGRGVFSCDAYYMPPTGIAKTVDKKGAMSLFPNPSDGRSVLSFDLAKASEVMVKVYDLQGKCVKVIGVGRMPAGPAQVELNCLELGFGTYLVSLEAGGLKEVTRMVIVK